MYILLQEKSVLRTMAYRTYCSVTLFGTRKRRMALSPRRYSREGGNPMLTARIPYVLGNEEIGTTARNNKL